MTILTKNIKFDDINIGDEIPSFEIEETQETMDKPQKNQWNLKKNNGPGLKIED